MSKFSLHLQADESIGKCPDGRATSNRIKALLDRARVWHVLDNGWKIRAKWRIVREDGVTIAQSKDYQTEKPVVPQYKKERKRTA